MGECLLSGFAFYYLSSVIVILGAAFGVALVTHCADHRSSQQGDLIGSMAAWDGQWYAKVASEGYAYDPRHESSINFFPAFPVLARALIWATGLRVDLALLLVSNAFLLAAFVLLAAYVQERFTIAPQMRDYALLALGLFPTTFYFHMAYTESIFLCLSILAMYGMQRSWPILIICAVIGLATATRPVGVALLLPLVLHLWQQSNSNGGFLLRCAVFLPVACWGLLAFMAYQAEVFGDPFTFVKASAHWNDRPPPATIADQLMALISMEPIRAVYDPSCTCFWGRDPPRDTWMFNLSFAHPIFFLLAVGIVAAGAKAKWLNRGEVVLAAGLLLIPYIAEGYRKCMASEARYASVVFPIYLVLGRLLSRLPAPLAAMFVSVGALVLGIYSALFVSWYWFF